ncbi:hypothetical protein D3C71_1460250 [compost metagenome]
MHEFRVALEAQHLVANVVRRIRAEIAGGDHRSAFRQFGHLVLVTDQQGQLRHLRVHPRRMGRQRIAVDTHAPALLGTLGLATQGQRQQLVAETHTQQLLATLVQLQQVGLEGLDPRVGTKRVGLAARHQVGIEHFVVGGIIAIHHVVHTKFGGDRLTREELLEHPAVALVLRGQLRSQDIGFKDADA